MAKTRSRVVLAGLTAALLAAGPASAQMGGYASGSSSSSSGGTRSTFSSSSGGGGTAVTIAPSPSSSSGGTQAPSFSSGSSGKTLEAAFPARGSQKAADFFGGVAVAAAAKPGPGAVAGGPTVLRGPELQRRRLVAILDDAIGTPYRAGGRDPGHGLDSAGLIWHAYRSIQRTVTDDSEDQQRLGTRFPADQFVERGKLRDDARLATGDILYFRVGLPQQGLTGYRPVIYYGDGLGVYPSQSKGRVVLEDIRDRARALAFVQRVLQ